MLLLRHLLFIVVLFFAQQAAGVHAVEHVAGNEDGLPTHVCQLCLAAHDLATVLPSLAVLPPVQSILLVPAEFAAHARSAFPAPLAIQRGPPLS